MRLFTSSYRTWRPELGSPVVISLLTPKWLPESAGWPRCVELTPRWKYFKSGREQFDAEFTAQLDRYGPQHISRRLTEIARQQEADRLVLLCWETTTKALAGECHRRLFADWMLATTGEDPAEVQ